MVLPSVQRPDEDIEEEIGHLIRSFATLKASRPYFTYHSERGQVTLKGNVRSAQARAVLIDNIPRLRGVVGCDATALYEDEALRFEVAQLIPPGLFANVHYGVVGLTGQLPTGASAEAIINAINQVSGVRRVTTDFIATA
jgi:osmotically-inducible protein OsmY